MAEVKARRRKEWEPTQGHRIRPEEDWKRMMNMEYSSDKLVGDTEPSQEMLKKAA
jgi:hypothetical protein